MRKKKLLEAYRSVSGRNIMLVEQNAALRYGQTVMEGEIKGLKDEIDQWKEKHARLLERYICVMGLTVDGDDKD